MSVGTATWTQDGARREVPILLRPLLVEPERGRDFYLTLLDGVRLNPIIVTELRTRGDDSSLTELVPAPGAGKAFDPRPVWNALRERGALFGDDFVIVENLLVGAYDDPEQRLLDDLDDCDAVIGASDILAAVAGDQDAVQSLASALPAFPKGDRDPFAERGIGDLDDNQFAALDVIATGRSVFLQTPPGADGIGMASAVAADAAASGKAVTVVSGSDSALRAVGHKLEHLGAGDLLIDGTVTSWNAEARARLLAAITLGAVEVDDAKMRTDGEQMLAARYELQQRFDALHRPHRPWGVSAFEAVQAVVRLTSSSPAPETSVRLGADAGAIVAEHGFASVAAELVGRLSEAAEDVEEETPPTPREEAPEVPAEDLVPWWNGVTGDVQRGAKFDETVATLLVRYLPKMRTEAALAAHETGVDEAPSLAVWADQVTMFDDIRAILEVFSPAVFHRSLHDLVAATAPSSSSHHHEIPRRDRRGMVRRAVELLRPGRGKEDLHENLVKAHEQALQWRAHSPAGGWPVIPDDFDIFSDRLHTASNLWEVIADAVEQVSGEADLAGQPWDRMVAVLSQLAEGIPGSLDAVETVPIEADMATVGFAELMADLKAREASPDQVRRDLEFAWWAAAFDAIVASDARLTQIGALGEVVETFLERDGAFSHSRFGPLMRAVAERRRTAIVRHPDYARDLFAALVEGGDASLKELWRDYAPLVTSLRPVVLAGAEQVARMAPPSRCIDIAVVVAGESLALAELVSTLARARQVVVIGDSETSTRSAIAVMAHLLPHIVMHATPQPRDPRVTSVLASAAYGRSLSALPAADARGMLTVTHLDAIGAPVAGAAQVESTRAEVTAVVDHVTRVRDSLPRRALAVVAGNDLHASRIADALAEKDERLAHAVSVVVLGEAAGVAVDDIVISLGYATNVRGVSPARLGAISESWGKQALLQALAASTERLQVFSALDLAQLGGAASEADDGHGIDDLRELMTSVQLPAVSPERPDPGPSDWLLADIAGRLRRHGLAVRLRYGNGSDTIAMVVGGRHDRNYSVAVVTDESAPAGSASLRDRMRWQYSTLEALGWTVVSLWTLDVFMDPDSAIEQVLAALGSARPEDDLETGAIEQPALDIEVERIELPVESDDDVMLGHDNVPFAIADLRVDDSAALSDIDVFTEGAGDEPHPQTLGVSALVAEQAREAAGAEVHAEPEPEPEPAKQPVLGFGVPKLVTPQDPTASVDSESKGDSADSEDDTSTTDGAGADGAETDAKDTQVPDVKARHRGADRPLIPTRAWEDNDEGWGGSSGGSSRDDEIKRDKPPHW